MPITSKLRLMYSPVQQVFMFVFGDSPQRMGVEPLYFKTKREAITAARRQGLDVDKKGYVKSYLMVEMEALLSKRGYNPADAELLMSEGMGPTELEERLKRAPGSVGSLEYTHKLEKVRQDRGLSGVSPRSRKGTRVRFNASPGSLVLYNHHPDIGEEGTVTTMPGFGQRTYLPGPGGGLLYVYWDQSGTIGVSPNDVEKVRQSKGLSGVGGSAVDKLDAFTRQYLETALWSTNDESTPEGGEPLDANYGVEDFAPKAFKQAIHDCKAFQKDNSMLLAHAGDAGQNGHDFWLTRNGHGAGFWDRGYDKRVSDGLTKASKVYGSVDIYVGDDGQLHF